MTFGERLRAARRDRGPLCVGVDPHPSLLHDWGMDDDVAGLERFCGTVVDALADRVAVLKPQIAFFERHGSRGVAVLERLVADARSAGAVVVVDAKRGDIGSTVQAYADAFVREGSPLAGDAVTVSPYLGSGSLDPLVETAAEHGRGVFVLSLTSNPEGARVQRARTEDGRTGRRDRARPRAGTQRHVRPARQRRRRRRGDRRAHRRGPRRRRAAAGPRPRRAGRYRGRRRSVPRRLPAARAPSTSREVLRAGPGRGGLRDAAARTLAAVRAALGAAGGP